MHLLGMFISKFINKYTSKMYEIPDYNLTDNAYRNGKQ